MKTWLVIKREYWTRVRKKTFILMTILVPFLMIGVMALSIGITLWSNGKKNIAILDPQQLVANQLESNNQLTFSVIKDGNLETLKTDKSYDAVISLEDLNTSSKVNVYSTETLGLQAYSSIESKINKILTEKRISAAGIDVELLNKLKGERIELIEITKDGKESSSQIAAAIGYGCGILLYMFMFFYGMNVMRSVMEEKTNRIAEIIVSSIKPFQLMLGKIIGVALVGLTQFGIWILLITIASFIFSGYMMTVPTDTLSSIADAQASGPVDNVFAGKLITIIQETNWVSIIGWFIFYFLGGYFLYASLFAAVGSLVDEDAQDAQQFTIPITLPIIIGFMILTSAMNNPNGTVPVIGSIVPLTSPIVMMARIPYGITGDLVWQLALSAALLILGFIATTALAAKIYRTGILMYGKKVTFKDVIKWFRYK